MIYVPLNQFRHTERTHPCCSRINRVDPHWAYLHLSALCSRLQPLTFDNLCIHVYCCVSGLYKVDQSLSSKQKVKTSHLTVTGCHRWLVMGQKSKMSKTKHVRRTLTSQLRFLNFQLCSLISSVCLPAHVGILQAPSSQTSVGQRPWRHQGRCSPG